MYELHWEVNPTLLHCRAAYKRLATSERIGRKRLRHLW